jgi:hypothetical protein
MSDPFSRPTNSDYLNAINATKFSGDSTAWPTGYVLLYSSTSDSQFAVNGLSAKALINVETGQIITAYLGPVTTPGSTVDPALLAASRNINVRIANNDASVTDQMQIQVDRFNVEAKNAATSIGFSFTKDNVFVTGNSEGGLFAQLSSRANGFAGATYGAPGIPGNANFEFSGNDTTGLNNYYDNRDIVGNTGSEEGRFNKPSTGSQYHYGNDIELGSPLTQGLAADSYNIFRGLDADAGFGAGLTLAYLTYRYHGFDSYGRVLGVNLNKPQTVNEVDLALTPDVAAYLQTMGATGGTIRWSADNVPTLTLQFQDGSSGTISMDELSAGQYSFLYNQKVQGSQGRVSVRVDTSSGVDSVETAKDNGTSTKTVFDTGTEPWSTETSAFDVYKRLQSQRVDFDNGSQQTKQYDPDNKHPYKELDVTKGPDGEISAEAKLEQNIIAAGGSVGQIFGSALGRALAPNNQFAQLAVGTVAGLIGQKLLQTFTASLTVDASRFVVGDFASVSGLDVANAGLGAISSFLTAELGRGLGLTGFGAELFNGAVGGVTGSVLTQVATKVAAGYSFDAAVGFINWSTAATQAGYNVSAAVGSFLAHQFVHPESHEGAVGGQLFGAVGSALGLAAVINASLTGILGFLIPGLGSFFGTIVGTILGDAIAGDPVYPMAYHDVRILGSDTHFTNRLVGTDNHGNAAVSEQMGDQVATIANSYLDAVHGAGIAYSGKVMTGYNAGAAPYQYITGWFPNGTEVAPHFANATDAIQEGVRELLVNTEVIGGDLLMKRAHQAFINGPHPAPTENSPDFSDLTSLSGNLSVAQDYENYLNNREAINALIAANPNTAFAAGWIATFARVNDLGLNHMKGSDFLGGLAGYIDSLNKAGLGAEAANAIIYRGAGNSVAVDVKIANGVEVPGALSVFADQFKVSSDASGQTLHFTVDSGIVASGAHFLLASSQAGDGDSYNDFWIGGNGGGNFTGTGGHDILVGGAGNDNIWGGAGFDFIAGGYGNDYLFGQDGNDILRGGANTDFLFGGAGDDTYVFNRGDGVDIVLDEVTVTTPGFSYDEWRDDDGDGTNELHHVWVPETTAQADAGTDSLVFGPGIARSDIVLVQSGNDLIVYVKDPAHPGASLTDNITLQRWFDSDGKDRIEKFAFADGATLNLSSGNLAPYLIPFGASLSHSSLVEKSAAGTVVGTVVGYDLQPGAALSYSIAGDPSGAFAVNAATGVITTTVPLNYEINAAHALTIAVRVSDGAHFYDQPFTINLIDMPNRAPVLSVPASTIKAYPGQPLQVASWFNASDPDNDAMTYFFQDGATAANSGYFALNGTPYAQGANFGLTAAQLAGLTFVPSPAGVADDLSMQLSDGHAVSAIGAFHVNVNRAPVLSVPSSMLTGKPGQALQVSSWFNASDPDNDALTYFFQDGAAAANSGYFALNGTPYAQGANFGLTAAQLAGLTFVASAAGVADDMSMQLSDGHAVSAIGVFHVDVVNHAPVLTQAATNFTVNPGQSLQVASWFSAYDPDNVAMTYYF